VNAAQRQFVNFVKSRKPKKIQDLRGGRYIFRPIGSGAFRDAYAVWTKRSHKDLQTVVKMPIEKDGIKHARYETKAIGDILRLPKFISLRRYMPEIFYYEHRTGVIVVRRYEKIPWSFQFYGFVTAFTSMVDDLMNLRYDFDGGSANFAITSKGDYILLDAGLLGETR
jgi:hypothetical protein